MFILLFVAVTAVAQDRTVTGRVTAKEDGLPLPGVSVKVKGSTSGTQTGADGRFTLKAAASAQALQFSFIGYTTQEVGIPASNTVNVVLVADAKQLDEVVFVAGALGTTRTTRSTANNAQIVTANQLTTIRETNINNALAGKVAGIQVRSQSVAALGRQTEVRLRGASGFGLGSGALM